MKCGCQASSARCRRLSLDRLTLLGIFSSVSTAVMSMPSSPATSSARARGAQVDVGPLPAARAHLLPPVDEVRLPGLECALQALVARQVDVVGNLLVGQHGGHV